MVESLVELTIPQVEYLQGLTRAALDTAVINVRVAERALENARRGHEVFETRMGQIEEALVEKRGQDAEDALLR